MNLKNICPKLKINANKIRNIVFKFHLDLKDKIKIT